MGQGWRAFRYGAANVLRYRQLLLILFVANLLGALLLALLPARELAAGLGYRPALAYQSADGLDPWLVIETLMAGVIDQTLAPVESAAPAPALQPAFLAWLAAVAATPVLAWLLAAFLSGGVLLIYVQAPRPFDWRHFFAGCWRWFGVFLLLGLFQGITVAILLAGMLLILGLAVAFLGAWGLWLSLPGLLLLLFWLALLDFTRLLAVAYDTRRLLRVFARAAGFVIRHTPALLVLYLLVYLLLGLLYLLYGWGIQPYVPSTWWPLLLLGQQLFILLALAVRLIRLAGGAALVMERA